MAPFATGYDGMITGRQTYGYLPSDKALARDDHRTTGPAAHHVINCHKQRRFPLITDQ